MTRFTHNQRIVVSNPNNPDREPLRGYTGFVCRLRRVDSLAWIQMDKDLPEGFFSFMFMDGYDPSKRDARWNHILMDPAECSPQPAPVERSQQGPSPMSSVSTPPPAPDSGEAKTLPDGSPDSGEAAAK